MYITSGITIRSVNFYNLSRPIHPCRCQLADGHQGSSEGALDIALDILGRNTSGKSRIFMGFIWDIMDTLW